MKILKKIGIWIAFSLIIQFVGLLYLNNYLFASSQAVVKVKKIEKKETEEKKVEVKVPEGVKHINTSFDAKYLAYYEGEILKVVNTKTGDIKNVEFDEKVKVSFYKWLPDRNRMLIAEKHDNKNGSGFKLSYYDVDKDVKEEVKDLTWADQKSEVEDIQVSTLTNVIYVKVAHSGKRSSIYWVNIMKDMKKVDTRAYMIGNMRVIPHEDKLVYEDLSYGKIYSTNISKPITIKDVKKPVLLAIDSDDNIYIGDQENDKVKRVYYGKAQDSTENWKKVDLQEAVDKKDVFVTENGNIYVNDNLKGVVIEVSTGKQTSYEGTFLQMYSNGIATISDNKLMKTSFK